MADFNEGFQKVLKVEGGYSDHAADRGGATRFGITRETLSQWRGSEASAEDVKNLSQAEAGEIYRAMYWDRLKLNEVQSQQVANLLFDQAVNAGVRACGRRAQTVINSLRGAEPAITVDGLFGPVTIQRLNAIEPKRFSIAFLKATQLAYVEIVSKEKSQVVFLKGWINRTHALLDEIEEEREAA